MSWGVYLLAAGGLLIVLMPTVTAVDNASQAAMARGEVGGVAQVLDSLSPGITVTFSTGPGGYIDLSGHNVSETTPGGSASATCLWLLPDLRLAPERTYTARLIGRNASVIPYGIG